ncbi:MAG: hypothetical protein ACE5R6_14770 [Candidatus Heimdallarchaeota archaeon]
MEQLRVFQAFKPLIPLSQLQIGLKNLVEHPHVPLAQVPGELGLVDRFDVAESRSLEGIGIQGVDHVLERFGIPFAHFHDSKDL